MSDIASLVPAGTIVPVLAFDSVDEALAICTILSEAGLPLEITLRTPIALECIRVVARELPGSLVGAGTVLNPEQASQAIDAGARFGVSPGLTPALADAVNALNWPFLPGVATVGEAMAASESGFSYLKFFPAEASGGVAFLKALSSVLPELRFCPTGGIKASTVTDYLSLPNVFAAGGSWMVVRNDDGSPDLDGIRREVKACGAFRQ